MTDLEKLAVWYLVWVVSSGCPLWVLARWSARQKQVHTVLLLAAAGIIVICVGLVVHAMGESSGPRQIHPSVPKADTLLLAFVPWPFASCLVVARASHWFTFGPGVARWLAFAAGMLIAVLCPFALLMAGCGLAGACL